MKNIEQGSKGIFMLTDEQFLERFSGIGGSDAAAVLGLSKWKTPLDVYLEKTGQDTDDTGMDNINIRVGNKVEPYLRELYAKETGFAVEDPEKTFRCDKNPFMIANIDGLIRSENLVLEIKTASHYMEKFWGDEGSDDIPDEYHIQGVHYSCVLKPKRVDVIVSFLDDTAKKVILNTKDDLLIDFLVRQNFKIFHYHPNERLEKAIISSESEFWHNNVKKMIPPSPLTIKEAATLYHAIDGRSEIASTEVIEAINTIKSIKAQLKELENNKSIHELTVCNSMKDASMLVDPSGNRLATWNSQTSKRLNTTAAKELIDCLSDNEREEYYVESNSRVLRIS